MGWKKPDPQRSRTQERRPSSRPASPDRIGEKELTESVGNFLKTDQSLVMRSKRLKRYSDKYRDSIVRRLLSGSATMAQIRQEKEITEGELIDWVADLVDRMQAKLDTFEESGESSRANGVNNGHLGNTPDGSFLNGATIEGQVKSS